MEQRWAVAYTHPPDDPDALRLERPILRSTARTAYGPAAPQAAGQRPARRTLAQRADPYDLYERAVQSPEADCAFFADAFRRLRKRTARVLREDFCGTANLAATWCRGHRLRRAVGVDLDAPTLAWGTARHVGARLRDRVTLHRADVREVSYPLADVTCAMNFSFCGFHTRAGLRSYLESARRGLAADGLLILEMYGGLEAMGALEETTEHDGFTYVWDQGPFDAISHRTRCRIHFRFPDASELREAFTYDWRLWSIPELRELLLEAGFARVRIFWQRVEDDPDDPSAMIGSGEYEEVTEAENQEGWLVYVVAER